MGNKILTKSRIEDTTGPTTAQATLSEMVVNTNTGKVYVGTNLGADDIAVGATSKEASWVGAPIQAAADLDNAFGERSDTKLATSTAIYDYVNAQIATENTIDEMDDTTITTPGDAAMLLYDTGTAKWRDAAMSGHATISDTGGLTIEDNVIDSSHYVDGSIDNAHIADDAIDSEHYADGSIDNAHIADDQIDSEHYVDGSIDNAHIADDAIDSEHYADGSIDTAHIAALQVTTAKIAADAIDGTKLADNAVDSEHYTDGSIDTAHVGDNQITLAKMAGGTDGNVISYDASGDPVAIATGTDGQVLTSTGAGSPPAFEDSVGVITALTNGADNRVITATSSSALNAEENFSWSGTTMSVKSDTTNAPEAVVVTEKANLLDSLPAATDGVVASILVKVCLPPPTSFPVNEIWPCSSLAAGDALV